MTGPAQTGGRKTTPLARLERSLLGHISRAIRDWKLVEEGDRVMACLSGGKDSFTLVHLLGLLRERAPVRFEIVVVNLDQGHPGFPAHVLEQWLSARGFEHRMLREDTHSIVKEKSWGKTYCGLCSRLRRGVLYRAAQELGATKIALGHHRDDALETLVMNLLFAGQLKAMPARLLSDDGRNTVIRPLLYAPEEEIAAYARLMAFPVIPCDLCGSQENLQRKQVKAWLTRLEDRYPGAKSSMMSALADVRPTHLLDPRLSKSGGRAEGGTEEAAHRFGALLPVLGELEV